jgi:hypothetical protein
MGVASMKKWYFGVALVAGWLGQTGTAGAQYIPTPVGAARIAEPIPCPTPNLVEGPISPLAAPPGPPCGTDLPAGHSSAFQCEEYVRDDHCFAHFGAVGLMRQKLGHFNLAVLDPVSLKDGIPAPPGSPTLQSLDMFQESFQYGPKATLGYLWQNQAIELTGFWIPSLRKTLDSANPGQIDLPFVNPPLGFEGDNGLWLHADVLHTEYRSSLWSGEVNYRYTDAAVTDAELILGVRYVGNSESLGIVTGDDDLTVRDAQGNPDPTRQATYQIRARNHIVAPQVGFEWGTPCTKWARVGVNAKAALGVNFAEIRTTLVRGDGLVGFDQARHSTVPLAQVYDLGAFVDFDVCGLERLRLRIGYNAMFLVNVVVPEDNLNFNLGAPTARTNNNGSIFYHGPMAELEFLF